MENTKNRHGCLTAYLILILIANSATALIYLFFSSAIREQLPNLPEWSFPVLIIFGIFNLVCIIAIFKWKKWGFWGSCLSASIIFVINLSIGLRIAQALGGLIGIAILYGVLQIGKEDKGWPQLD